MLDALTLSALLALNPRPACAPAPQTAAPAATHAVDPEDAARRAFIAGISPSIVSVTSFIAVPPGAPLEGRWLEQDDSPHKGFVRHLTQSGIVISSDGTIICCRSPLTDDDGGLVEIIDVENSEGTRLRAELLGTEPTINLAVLRLLPADGAAPAETPKPPEGFVPAKQGVVDDILPGDAIFAFGDPFGAAKTFAPGVVMALPTASCYQADLTGSFIHASMAVSPGAVGGALVNRRGEVVGMIVPPPSKDPKVRLDPHAYTTFGMQVQTAVGVGEALKKKRTNESPWIGFSVLSMKELRAKLRDDAKFDAMVKPPFGLYIDDIYTPSPAANAGIQHGDFIVEINGLAIRSVVDFQQALYYSSGTSVPLRIFRAGKDMTPIVKIERRPNAANRN